MTIAIVNTDMNIGPFKIPGNGQNMILNNYAERNKKQIDTNKLFLLLKKKKIKKSNFMLNSSTSKQ